MSRAIEVAAAEVVRLGARTSIVRLVDRSGRTGVGECSPLPGRSPDSPDDAMRALQGAVAAPLPPLPSTASAIAAAISIIDRRFPAARLALETALFDLAAQLTSASVAELLSPRPAIRLACSAIVSPDGAGAPPGIGTWKVKLGEPGRLERDLDDLRRAVAGRDIQLRLDINRQWSAAEAGRYLPLLADLEPEWIEEPTSAADLLALGPPSVPIALDESLLDAEAGTIRALERGLVRALVIKPAVLGGLSAAAAWAGRARRAGAVPIVSHLLDGPVALAAYAELALALASPGDPAAGLGLHAGLAALPAAAAPQLAGGLHLESHRGGLGVAL
jgi:L-alanine-DL-glutamate epimerase-like enolase superfamily enzyme